MVFPVAVRLRRPLSDVIVALIGLAIVAYGIVRCFDIPNLGAQLVPGGAHAITQLEGGPFVVLSGGLLLVLGALGDVLTASARSTDGPRLTGRWGSGTSMPPPHAAR